jgi:hypothetical protein
LGVQHIRHPVQRLRDRDVVRFQRFFANLQGLSEHFFRFGRFGSLAQDAPEILQRFGDGQIAFAQELRPDRQSAALEAFGLG